MHARPPALLSRRHLLLAAAAPSLPLLGGCATPLPLAATPAGDARGAALLAECAQAHGVAAFRQLTDINIAYDGQWRPLIDRIQPEVVDAGYRGPSEERILLAAGATGQAYRGPRGRKQVAWQRAPGAAPDARGEVRVWYDGQPATGAGVLDAAALVAEAYQLFLLGPLWLAGRPVQATAAGTEAVDGRVCEVVQLALRPGLGRTPLDRVALCIDSADRILRRMRFTLEGYGGTRGAVAEVDTYDHARRFGVLWPMRSFERVVHPIALPAHDWRITGLDVNRGYAAADILGPAFTGAAARPAQPLGT